MANIPIGGYYRRPYQDFSGGMNTFGSALTIPANQFTQLDNAIINEKAVLEKQKGYIVDGSPFPDTAASFIRMLVNYRKGVTVDALVVAALDAGNTNATYKVDLKRSLGDGVYQYIGHTTGTATLTNGNTAVTGSGTTWLTQLKAGDKIKATSHADSVYAEIQSVNTDTSITLTANYGGASTGGNVAYIARVLLHKDYIPTSINFNSNLIIANGSDYVMTYNGTTLTRITDTDVPRAKYLESHKNRAFMALNSSVYWSYVNDETTYDAASFEPIFPQDGQDICAIKSFADSLLVFKDNGSIYQMVGAFDQSAVGEVDFIRKIDIPDNLGTIDGKTVVVNDDNKAYFLSETGIYTIDARMYVQKISWDINPTVQAIKHKSDAQTSKSYLYDTKSQWDSSGAHVGTVATTAGVLGNHFDLLEKTNASKTSGLASVFIDSSQTVHIAYVDSVNSGLIRYINWSSVGVELEETAVTESYAIGSVSISVKTGGEVGIAYTSAPSIVSPSTNVLVKYIERKLIGSPAVQTWGNSAITAVIDGPFNTDQGANYIHMKEVCLAFDGSSYPCVIFSHVTQVVTTTYDIIVYRKWNGSSWATAGTAQSDTSSLPQIKMSLILATNNPRITWINPVSGYLHASKSENAGATWASVDSIAMSVSGRPQLALNAAGNLISGFVDSSDGKFKTRNHTTATTATIDANANGYGAGFAVSSTVSADQTYAYNIIGAEPDQIEKYIFESTATISSPSANIIDRTLYVNDGGMTNNGRVFATVAFGMNADTLLVRRVSFRGVYTSTEAHDTTATEWRTYVVTNPQTNGGTITYENALKATASPTAYASIVSGAVVSVDPTLIYIITRVTILLASWQSPTIDMITINYTGAGIDAKFPVGYVYNNEVYFACTANSGTENNEVVFLDRIHAWGLLTYPVTALCKYKTRLYAGSASTGKVYVLKQGYNFNGSAYTLTATCKEDILGSLELQKDIYKIYIIYEIKPLSSFTFSYRIDNYKDINGSTWTDETINQTQDGIAEILVGKPASSIQTKVTSSGLDTQLGIIGIVILYGYLNLR